MKNSNLQEQYLRRLQALGRSVTVFLMNGFQLRGVITGSDAFTVVVVSEQRQQVIYKHAISTIVAERPVELSEESEGGEAKGG